MKMKKLLTALLALAMVSLFFLAGCASTSYAPTTKIQTTVATQYQPSQHSYSSSTGEPAPTAGGQTTRPTVTMTTTAGTTTYRPAVPTTTAWGTTVSGYGSVPSPNQGTIGLSTGGAKDITNFRENINNHYLPLPTDVSYEGLFTITISTRAQPVPHANYLTLRTVSPRPGIRFHSRPNIIYQWD
jgi:hypothetical protein